MAMMIQRYSLALHGLLGRLLDRWDLAVAKVHFALGLSHHATRGATKDTIGNHSSKVSTYVEGFTLDANR